MKIIKQTAAALLTVIFLVSCAGKPQPQLSQPNSAQSQKENAKRAQDELSTEISR